MRSELQHGNVAEIKKIKEKLFDVCACYAKNNYLCIIVIKKIKH